MARSEETRAAWLEALAEMEQVAGIAGDPSVTPAPWVPRELGPLPDDLVPRARAVESAQRSAMQRVKDAQRRVASHLGALRTVPKARQTDQSVYLDVTG